MALQKDVNSYLTVAEADSYFGDRIDVAAWSSASPEVKAQALVTASSNLNHKNWVGTAISVSQTLAFPRYGQYYDPLVGAVVTLSTSVPKRILDATCELAYHLINNDGLLDDTGTVKHLSVGQITLDIATTPSKTPSIVMDMIKPLLGNGGSNIWWRAN